MVAPEFRRAEKYTKEGQKNMLLKEAVVQRALNLLIDRGMCINEIALVSGVTPSTYYSMMDPNRREIHISTIKKFCDGMDITIYDFFHDPIFIDLDQEIF